MRHVLLWHALCFLNQEGSWFFKCYFLDIILTPLYFLGIDADVLKAKKLHLIGFTHDQVVKQLLCNLIMCGPYSPVFLSRLKMFRLKNVLPQNLPFLSKFIFSSKERCLVNLSKSPSLRYRCTLILLLRKYNSE